MNKSRTAYIVSLFFSVAVSLILAVVRSLALITEFDTDASYYDHAATLPSVFAWGALFAVIVVFVIAVINRDSFGGINPASHDPAIVFSSSLVAFMIIAVFVFDIFTFKSPLQIPVLLTLIFAFPAALYHLIGIAIPVKSSNVKVLLSVFMMLWLFAVTLSIYFKDGIAINNPNRILELASVSLFLLFFVNECRYTVGTEKPWRYVFFGFASVIVSGIYSLPNIILVIMKLYPDTLDVSFEFIGICIWIYIMLRMCVYAEKVGTDEEKEAETECDDGENGGEED